MYNVFMNSFIWFPGGNRLFGFLNSAHLGSNHRVVLSYKISKVCWAWNLNINIKRHDSRFYNNFTHMIKNVIIKLEYIAKYCIYVVNFIVLKL